MFRLALTLALAVLCTASPAQTFRRDFQNWELVCAEGIENPDSCFVATKFVSTENRRYWVRAGAKFVENKRLRIVFSVPSEAKVFSSIFLRGDKAIQGRLFHVCDETGCEALWELDQTVQEELLWNTTLAVQYAVSESDGIGLLLPLGGLKDALDELKRIGSK